MPDAQTCGAGERSFITLKLYVASDLGQTRIFTEAVGTSNEREITKSLTCEKFSLCFGLKVVGYGQVKFGRQLRQNSPTKYSYMEQRMSVITNVATMR
jgi:hypothetical protein